MNNPRKCHSERSEESSSAFARGRHTGFFTSFKMTNRVVHQQRSEESNRATACVRAAEFLAPLRMTIAVLGIGVFIEAPSLHATAENPPGTGRVDFFGYTGCVLLENETTRVVLCHQAGGRVLEYSLRGKNSLWLDPEQKGWENRPGAPAVDLCGGRFDIGPEMIIPRRPALWLGA